jgi:N-acetylglucosaminyl-diphospho-decaprenol L-rhamnosyltransferase
MVLASVTVVFVTYNSAAVIGGALQSLPPDCNSIVVDNASNDDSAAIAANHGATVIQRTDNAGFGVGCNDGIFASSTPYVLLLNPDARLRPGALEALLATAENHPDAWLMVPTLYRDDGSRFEKWQSTICDGAFRPYSTHDSALRMIGFASGAAILLRRETIVSIGGFDPDLFLFFEDDDLSRRVLNAGGHILHVVSAEVDHAGGTSSPPSAAMTEMKHWHMAWSERHVRLKHGMLVWSRWKVLESVVKLVFAKLSGNQNEQAKQRGALNGTLANLRSIKAQDVRAQVICSNVSGK